MWPRSRSGRRGVHRAIWRIAGLAVALVVASGGCTPGQETRPRPTQPPERPPPAGTLRLGYPEEPITLNPIRAVSAPPRDLLRAVLPSFFLVTPDLRYRPYLLAREPEVEVAA